MCEDTALKPSCSHILGFNVTVLELCQIPFDLQTLWRQGLLQQSLSQQVKLVQG